MSSSSQLPPGTLESGILVLIVDDVDVRRHALHKQLEPLALCISSANCSEAREHLRCRRYDLFVADDSVIGADGLDVTAIARVCEEQMEPHLPVIVTAAEPFVAMGSRATSGADAYIAKPVSIDAFRVALERVLPPTSRARTKPLDSRVLAEFVGRDGDVHTRYFRLFAQTARQIVSEVSAAEATGDMETIGWHAHKLKSSADAVGAKAIATACRAIEVATANDEHAELVSQCATLRYEMRRVDAYVEYVAPATPHHAFQAARHRAIRAV